MVTMQFEDVVAFLRECLGQEVCVTLMTRSGELVARLSGTLGESAIGAEWGRESGEPPVAFAVAGGATFLMHVGSFSTAYWVSRERRFLVAEHTDIDVGVELVG